MTNTVGSPTVLIVEDHEDTRDLLRFVFENAGFSVCGVGSVAEAVGRLLAIARLPALIVSDIVMPGASGAEFIRYIRANEALKQIPIIAVTGAKLTEVPREATLVVQKPVDPYALVRVANQVLAVRRSYPGPSRQVSADEVQGREAPAPLAAHVPRLNSI